MIGGGSVKFSDSILETSWMPHFRLTTTSRTKLGVNTNRSSPGLRPVARKNRTCSVPHRAMARNAQSDFRVDYKGMDWSDYTSFGVQLLDCTRCLKGDESDRPNFCLLFVTFRVAMFSLGSGAELRNAAECCGTVTDCSAED